MITALTLTVWILVTQQGYVAPVQFATQDSCERIRGFMANPFNFSCLKAEVPSNG